MRRALLSALVLVLAVAPVVALEVQSTNSYLIKIHGNSGNLASAVAAAGGTLQRVHSEIGYASATSTNPSFADNLRGSAGVQSVDRDLKINWVPQIAVQAAGPVASAVTAVPTAAFFYPCQWNLEQIDAPAAWAAGAFGAGIKVAVLDTGGDPFHNDLAARSTCRTASACSRRAPRPAAPLTRPPSST